jgi:hypothetical protein
VYSGGIEPSIPFDTLARDTILPIVLTNDTEISEKTRETAVRLKNRRMVNNKKVNGRTLQK